MVSINTTKMSEFVTHFEDPSAAVNTIVDTEARRRLEKNQKVIESLLKVVMVCGKQGLALRDHRDDSIEWKDLDEKESPNQGNFVELVRFRAETDEVLACHLANAPRNAVYTSKTIQNSLVGVNGNRIRNDILTEVKRARFFTIIGDEVADVSNKEQLLLALRYVLHGVVKEVFVDFIEVERIIGAALATAIVRCLVAWELPLSHILGQCYDGASNMAGARSGCKVI